MDEFNFFILFSFIQGITEFLPISSSGHLALLPKFFQENDRGQIIDVAAHTGSLFAVIIYIRKELILVYSGLITLGEKNADYLKLFNLILVASFPIFIVGYVINLMNFSFLRLAILIAFSNIIFGLILLYCDRQTNVKFKFQTKDDFFLWRKMKYRDAILIGIAQIFALIPGASRSGVTISMSRFLGYDRITSARFSLFLSIPAIVGASFLKSLELVNSINYHDIELLFFIILTSFIFAYISIYWLMKFLVNFSYTVFVIYRLILGSIILFFISFNLI